MVTLWTASDLVDGGLVDCDPVDGDLVAYLAVFHLVVVDLEVVQVAEGSQTPSARSERVRRG